MILEHISITVNDLARSIRFYSEAFGFQILRKTPTTAYLYLDTDLLELMQRKEPHEERQPKDAKQWDKKMFDIPGLSHIGFRVDNLDTEIERLKKLGCKLISQPREYEPRIEYVASPTEDKLKRASGKMRPRWRIASVSDPDGTILELVER